MKPDHGSGLREVPQSEFEERALSGHAPAKPFLRLDRISKRFGAFSALRDIELTVNEGEFICFLGPSGCGKSTLLRIIAGLEAQTTGRLLESGNDISKMSPAERRFGILFQSYALFPNLNVHENIAYGLSRRLSRAELRKRAAELLELVDMVGADRKFPAQLSGGQQQRVALARAIAPSPRLLLLDEPLSALDAKVRVRLRRQIHDLQRRLAVTTIMVTHDQEEALTMADRIVVMNQGTVEQVGTPTEIYYSPATPFVANFVGKMNFVPAVMEAGHRLRLNSIALNLGRRYEGDEGEVLGCIRPEHVQRVAAGGLPATVTHVEFLGSCWRATLAAPVIGASELVMDIAGGAGFSPPMQVGEQIEFTIPHERIIVFPAAARAEGLPVLPLES